MLILHTELNFFTQSFPKLLYANSFCLKIIIFFIILLIYFYFAIPNNIVLQSCVEVFETVH